MDINNLAYLLQCLDLSLNIGQTSNDKIMKALDEQTEMYLKQIIKNQERIIKLLEDMGS